MDGHHAETQQVLDNLRNSQLIEELTNKVEKAQVFLKSKAERSVPVVYAVFVDFSTLNVTTLAELRRRQRDGTGIRDQRSSDLMVNEILGRADFPNGITPSPFPKIL